MLAARKFLALPSAERWLLLRAVLMLPAVTLALKTIGLRRCHLAMERLMPLRQSHAFSAGAARQRGRRTAWLVRVAATHGCVRASCLAQSLSVAGLLRRQRIPATLCIGVRKHQGQLEAHAWIECQNEVLTDDALVSRRFAPFEDIHRILGRRGAHTR